MQIDIQTSRLTLLDDDRQRIERRAQFALGRMGARIRRVDVRVCDVNGPRGGVDKRCRVQVHLDSGPAVQIEDFDSDLADLVDRCFERAARVATNRVRLTQERRRLRPAFA